jgi:hypothetical protein
MAKKRRLAIPNLTGILAFAGRAARFFVKSQLLTVLFLLCALGFWAGSQARPVRARSRTKSCSRTCESSRIGTRRPTLSRNS